jgi:SlyX protein
LDERNVLINPDILPILGLIKDKGIVMDEERLIDIEVKLAHQEHALDEVSQVLTDQQAQLSRLEQICQSLVERMRGMSEGTDEGDGGKPPHY